MNYDNASPLPNKWLQPDGSITTFDGTVVVPANSFGENAYNRATPMANKTITPDNKLAAFSPTMIYPSAGIAVSTGFTWGKPLDPARIEELEAKVIELEKRMNNAHL